jgi:hypothetical protein
MSMRQIRPADSAGRSIFLESYPKGQVPVPLRLTTWGPLDELSLIVIEPLTAPLAAGAKRIEITQLFPAGKDAPHALVWVKPAVVVIPVMLSAAWPVLLSVTVLAELVVPTARLPKLRLDGFTEPTAVGVGAGVGVGVGLGVGVEIGAGDAVGVGDGDAAASKEITEAEYGGKLREKFAVSPLTGVTLTSADPVPVCAAVSCGMPYE